MTFPTRLVGDDQTRAGDMLAAVMGWDEQIAEFTEHYAREMYEDEGLHGAPEHIWYERIVDRLTQDGAPRNPLAPPPVKDLSSAANCGGPYGQSFPSNFGIYCSVPPSAMPGRWLWNPPIPQFNSSSVSAYFNSVMVVEAGASQGFMSPGWDWQWGSHIKCRDVHNAFNLPGNPHVMDPGNDWGALLVMIFF